MFFRLFFYTRTLLKLYVQLSENAEYIIYINFNFFLYLFYKYLCNILFYVNTLKIINYINYCIFEFIQLL